MVLGTGDGVAALCVEADLFRSDLGVVFPS